MHKFLIFRLVGIEAFLKNLLAFLHKKEHLLHIGVSDLLPKVVWDSVNGTVHDLFDCFFCVFEGDPVHFVQLMFTRVLYELPEVVLKLMLNKVHLTFPTAPLHKKLLSLPLVLPEAHAVGLLCLIMEVVVDHVVFSHLFQFDVELISDFIDDEPELTIKTFLKDTEDLLYQVFQETLVIRVSMSMVDKVF